MSTTQSSSRFIQAEFLNPDTGTTVAASDCLIDTGADLTCIPESIAHQLGLQTHDTVVVATAAGNVSHLRRVTVGVHISWQTFHVSAVVLPRIGRPLIGWNILSQGAALPTFTTPIVNTVLQILGAIPTLKSKAVLILGQDTTEIHRLRAIQTRLSDLGYTGLIVKDITDIEIQSVEEKVNMLASISRFVICENSTTSGYIDELKICANNRFVTALLQEGGKGATWMQADYSVDYPFIKTFEYPSSLDVSGKVDEAVKWAEQKLEQRRQEFNRLYPWR